MFGSKGSVWPVTKVTACAGERERLTITDDDNGGRFGHSPPFVDRYRRPLSRALGQCLSLAILLLCYCIARGSENGTTGTVQRASFLFDRGATRAMNVLSHEASQDGFASVLRRQVLNGDTTVWLYVANQRDGRPAPTTIYRGIYGGEIDGARIGVMRQRLEAYRRHGLRVVAWLTADDSRALSGASLATHLRHVELVHKHLGDLIDEYCVGLEMNEDDRRRHAATMIAHCRDVTGKRVGVHLTTGRWKEAVDWGAEVLYYQYGFDRTPEECSADTENVIKKLAGRCVFIGSEYHLSSDTDEARAIGRAIAEVEGCEGTGNGQ
jgi:hypothetical protein